MKKCVFLAILATFCFSGFALAQTPLNMYFTPDDPMTCAEWKFEVLMVEAPDGTYLLDGKAIMYGDGLISPVRGAAVMSETPGSVAVSLWWTNVEMGSYSLASWLEIGPFAGIALEHRIVSGTGSVLPCDGSLAVIP